MILSRSHGPDISECFIYGWKAEMEEEGQSEELLSDDVCFSWEVDPNRKLGFSHLQATKLKFTGECQVSLSVGHENAAGLVLNERLHHCEGSVTRRWTVNRCVLPPNEVVWRYLCFLQRCHQWAGRPWMNSRVRNLKNTKGFKIKCDVKV